jgi:predicted metal-dependent enzyme (double-stranded beta helix superfamily)|tara:strand:- start:882 stop:1439 length:558 start_codon:yes stop_codon:yes gene_type:complete
MDSIFRKYIERIQHILSEDFNERKIIEQVSVSTASFLNRPISLDQKNLKVPAKGYGRNLLYHDTVFEFVVAAMVWPPKVGTPIHDHGTWGVVGIAEGTLSITNYCRDNDSSSLGHASITELDTFSAGVGDTTHVLPPSEDIHKVWNPTTEQSISIHTYGKKIDRCNIFDVKSRKVEQIELSYINL